MPGLSSWPDDHGQVTGQGSFSPDQPGYLMIDPPDCKSLPPLNSKLLSRRRGVVFRTFRPPCDQPSTSIVPHSCSPKPMNSVHRYVPIPTTLWNQPPLHCVSLRSQLDCEVPYRPLK